MYAKAASPSGKATANSPALPLEASYPRGSRHNRPAILQSVCCLRINGIPAISFCVQRDQSSFAPPVWLPSQQRLE